MKVSEQFKSTIKAYLDNMAAVDSLFAPVYQKPTKNIDNCNGKLRKECNSLEMSVG